MGNERRRTCSSSAGAASVLTMGTPCWFHLSFPFENCFQGFRGHNRPLRYNLATRMVKRHELRLTQKKNSQLEF
jgi:hypothetical protein